MPKITFTRLHGPTLVEVEGYPAVELRPSRIAEGRWEAQRADREPGVAIGKTQQAAVEHLLLTKLKNWRQ